MTTLHRIALAARLALVPLLALGCAAGPRPASPGALPPPPDDLLTVAERSDYTATARLDEVNALCDRLAAASPLVRVSTLGVSVEGRPIPLLIIADPPISTPQQAARSGKPVVLLIGNIHAGETCGKEALMMLVRDIVTADPKGSEEEQASRGLLKHLVLAVVPVYNADGNEALGPVDQKRPGQAGPTGGDGVGTRENAKGLDLNRDYVKLESPEARALVRFMNEWDPAVFIDTHTTNGSFHRYTITYMGPTNPAGPESILRFTRDRLLPEVGQELLARSGYHAFFYGNLEGRDAEGNYTKWTTYPDLPRYGAPYFGLRNRLSILSEAYSYAPFKDRVLATRDFCRFSLDFLAANKDELLKMTREADDAAVAAGRAPSNDAPLVLRTQARPFADKSTILGFVEENRDGHRVSTGEPREYSVELINDFAPTVSVTRAFAYLYPRSLATITETLQRHGVEVQELREDIELDIEAYRIDAVTKAMRPFQGHELVDVNATALPRPQRIPAGTMVVRTAQKLGTLAAYLLEPRAADGLTAWNFFDDALTIGADFPVLRLPAPAAILTAPTRPLAESRTMNKPITPALAAGGRGRSLNFNGSPLSGFRWLPDGDHYLLPREGKLMKVDALSGRSEEYLDRAPVSAALATLPTIDGPTANSLAGSMFLSMNPGRTGAMFNYENDLYYAALDGSAARRLTSTPEPEEETSFSPDGEFVAFVRDFDLYVVDVATATERRLTTGGTGLVRNAKNDWVYYEEVFGRNWQAYWWAPDSRRLAFLQIDSTNVPRFQVNVDHVEPRRVEDTPYPRPGDPNPSARLGIVSAAGGTVRWADLSDYDTGNFLITGVGWLAPEAGEMKPAAESRTAYCYIQNRTQTWMDLLAVSEDSGRTRRLFRETTKAWVEPQGGPFVLKDGSFILASERDGYRHLYHFGANGKVINQITNGDFEARSIARVDEDAGVVYFNSTQRTWLGSNLYRANLDGSETTLVTASPVGPIGEPPLGASAEALGGHSISFSPNARWYIDTWSDHDTPPRVALFDASGSLIRTLDTNPVYSIEEYTRGDYQLVQIPMEDGFLLEASVLRPPGFDPSKKYPVWLMTYAGPHAPTVSDSWGGGRTYDEMLAQMGIVVFRVDPRSASGKGAVSAWSAYKQLGVQELKDLEAAVAWLAEQPGIDASRVGIAGGSYGGFMTSYALTHSKAFSAGIATASVTDWRDYDSIYTERYMLTPMENPEGYDAGSVVKGARNLHGRLLLIHGTMDDNVHMSNSLKLARALQDANKQFEFMIYPGSRHGVGASHVRRLNLEFIRSALRLEESGTDEDDED